MMEKKKRRYEQPTAAAVRIEHDIYLLAGSGETDQGRDTRPAKTNPFADDDNIDQWANASQD